VTGDVFIRFAPVLLTPGAGVGGIDRQKTNAVSAGLRGQPVAKYRSRDSGHGLAEAFTARTATHRLPTHLAGVGEVEVFYGDSRDVVAPGVADQLGYGVADLDIPPRRRTGEVDVDALRSADGVAVGVEAVARSS
jgi:type IV pilus biogenesis protein CpaD/CtpE